MSGAGLQSDTSGPQQLASTLPRVSPRLPRFHKTFSRYRDAQRSMRVPASRRSRYGLDWVNFFVADMQTGYGSFVAFYLAGLGWSQEMIGLALTIDNLLAVIGQIPGGALADSTTWKRGLVGGAILVIAAASVILALGSSPWLIYAAQALHGLTAGATTAAIAGISLGIVGRSAMSYRIGRNYRFSATGNAVTGAGMGIAGSYFGPPAIFLAAAALSIPALAALTAIRAEEIDYGRARNAGAGDAATRFQRIWDLRKNRLLFIFAAALVLFQLADAAMLPAISAHLGQDHNQYGIITGAMKIGILVIIPQIVVALSAPWVGYHSERAGRKPLLLIGLGVQVVRALILAMFDTYPAFAVAQVLDGISGAVIGVLTLLVVIDLTVGTGRFNLARGVVATLSSIAAALSTAGSGFLIDHVGRTAAFLAMVAAAAAAVAVVTVLLPETKPEKYAN
jgi:predicted MFS family arabinose efflux permease